MEDEIKIPTYFENRVDVKAETIRLFASAIKQFASQEKPFLSPNTQVILLTTIGQVSGNILTYMDQDQTEDAPVDAVQTLNEELLKLKTGGLAVFEESLNCSAVNVVNNNGIVVIVDAVLKPYNAPNCSHAFKVLNLFADQIVGFSFGEHQD